MYEYLLPIGSVVKLKNMEKKVMIFGVLQQTISDTKKFDYISVPYPEGYFDTRVNLGFNHDDIEEVVYKGYDGDEREPFINRLNSLGSMREENTDDNI